MQSRQENRKTERCHYVQFLAGAAQFGLRVGELHSQMLAFFFGEYGGLGGLVSTGAAYRTRELLQLQVVSLLSQLQDHLAQKNPTRDLKFKQGLLWPFTFTMHTFPYIKQIKHSAQFENCILHQKILDTGSQFGEVSLLTSEHSSRSSMSLRRWKAMVRDSVSRSSGGRSPTSSHCMSRTFSWLWVTYMARGLYSSHTSPLYMKSRRIHYFHSLPGYGRRWLSGFRCLAA